MTSQNTARETDVRVRALSRCVKDHGIAVLHDDADGRSDLSENLPAEWPSADNMPETLVERLAAAKAEALRTKAPQNLEVALGESPRQYNLRLTPDLNESGGCDGLFTVVIDITDRRRREVSMINLLRELNHRSKNLLAIVQGIALQTANFSGTTEDFLVKFRGRLQALARAQDLVTETNWRGTAFQSLVAAELSALDPALTSSIAVVGDNPVLGPNAALNVGLAIHELCVNALLHGSHQATDPTAAPVVIGAYRLVGASGAALLTIEWVEEGVPTNGRRDRKFGTMVLEKVVPLAVEGSADYRFEQGRIRYSLTIPAHQFEA